MEFILTVITLTGTFLLAILLFLALKPKLSIRISGIFSVVAAIGGLTIYGYGFGATLDSLLLASVRTLISVAGMFLGSMDFDSIADAPLFSHTWSQIVFWVIHLMAFYATVSAALSTFGAGLFRRLRPWFARWEDLYLIYGVHDSSLEFGRELLKEGKGCLLYMDENPEDGRLEAIAELGAVLRSDDLAISAAPKFLQSIGAVKGKRRIFLYALSADAQRNLQYAQRLLNAMESRNISPQQTSLVIRSREDSSASDLQVLKDRYGYGFVTVYQEADLAARMLIKEYPPCSVLDFDEQGRAQQDFDAMIIGFGRIGQTVLKNLIMNGQFVGSRFHATVVSPDCEAVCGPFANISGYLLKNYDITFCPFDARSPKMYEYLRQNGHRLRYLVLCTGSEKTNQELCEELTVFFERQELSIPIFQCTYQRLQAYDPHKKALQQHSLYLPEVLDARNLDEMAMVINHFYQGSSGTTPLNDWMHCDYFSRMSCRASADFLDAMLKMAGGTEEQALSQGWNLTEAQRTTLSMAEHLRWCAFHYCMGFAPMSQEEYDSRAEQYLAQRKAGRPTLRVSKNMVKRTHACLIPWEELDALSEKEAAILGKKVDFKAMDTENVMAVPTLLAIRKKLRQK